MASKIDVLPRFDHLTYRGNSKHSRHGWLRLTPAFSVHLIRDLIRDAPAGYRVLDPFCGTGTTALVCAENGVAAVTTDINPFLLWLGAVKCAAYSKQDISQFRDASDTVVRSVRSVNGAKPWVPPLFQIEKWWDLSTLEKIGKIRSVLDEYRGRISENAMNLLKIAFCRTMIETANVSFGHQSMSFKRISDQMALAMPTGVDETVISIWGATSESIAKATETDIAVQPRFARCDARSLTREFEREAFDCVITSPPYPNRMSYIRELRPYMYWLGYLTDARQAGELDWEAIGGTWGCATSNLTKWQRPEDVEIPFRGFRKILTAIADANLQSGPILSRYVEKYFCDMAVHVHELHDVLRTGGQIHYVVGNSKFYDVVLPVEQIFAALFTGAGFHDVKIKAIRKRSSKKELYEYIVNARK